MEEIWKDIVGYEGLYMVSSFGNVKSLDRIVGHCHGKTKPIKGCILKPSIDAYGYKIIGLNKNNHHQTKTIHRLVAIAFIPNPENKPEVNHKDTNKLNCYESNLEWATSKENIIHACKHGLHRKSGKPIIQFSMDGVFIEKFQSILEACTKTGVSRHGIILALSGKYRQSGGFKWSLINNQN